VGTSTVVKSVIVTKTMLPAMVMSACDEWMTVDNSVMDSCFYLPGGEGGRDI
jgi:hypothetical protein